MNESVIFLEDICHEISFFWTFIPNLFKVLDRNLSVIRYKKSVNDRTRKIDSQRTN